MTARLATTEEIARWDELILKNPSGGNVFSSYEYATIKRMNNYRPLFVIAGGLAVTVLEKATPPFGRLWYLPKGPNVTTTKALFIVLDALKPLAKRRGVFAVRIETELPASSGATLARHGLKKAAPIIPSPSTITLDISADLHEVLTSLPQKGRHAIRRAERDGVTAEPVTATNANCKTMFRLLSQTAEGQFGLRSYNYYKEFWQTFEKSGHGQLFFAYYQDKVVAGAFALIFGQKSTYKDGASVRQRTAYGASHLLQWRVIEWAKDHGSQIHDFMGSPPSAELENTDHPLYGVGRFKQGFSKDVHDFIGCYDLVLGPLRYRSWSKAGERVYRHYYYKRTKDYYY